MTVVDRDTVAPTPLFLGANPAEVPTPSSMPALRPLAAEEDLARSLVTAMSKSQRAAAIVSRDAPDDILTTAEVRLDRSTMPAPDGVAIADLEGKARDLFDGLLETYITRLSPELAAPRRETIERARPSLMFAWAGGTKRRERHYYRIQGDGVLIEYDNTQNDANHIHTVWRDPDGDFADDLLRRHYERHHAP